MWQDSDYRGTQQRVTHHNPTAGAGRVRTNPPRFSDFGMWRQAPIRRAGGVPPAPFYRTAIPMRHGYSQYQPTGVRLARMSTAGSIAMSGLGAGTNHNDRYSRVNTTPYWSATDGNDYSTRKARRALDATESVADVGGEPLPSVHCPLTAFDHPPAPRLKVGIQSGGKLASKIVNECAEVWAKVTVRDTVYDQTKSFNPSNFETLKTEREEESPDSPARYSAQIRSCLANPGLMPATWDMLCLLFGQTALDRYIDSKAWSDESLEAFKITSKPLLRTLQGGDGGADDEGAGDANA